jgi:hypothetical protein
VNGVAQRSGFAVATALFTLVVVGALAMGTLFAATHELRAGSDAIQQARAIMAAELGLEQTIATWNREWNGALARGYGRTSTLSTPEGARMTVHLTRLADELFLVMSDARAGPARRRLSRVVTLDPGDAPLLAALSTRAAVDIADSAGIDGSDRNPVGWDCPAPGVALAPFVVADTSTLLRFGQFDWGKLVEVASVRTTARVTGAAPRSTDEECDTTDPNNWGEPEKSNGGACTSYYPVIHAAGDLIVDGGRGQGLLLVDGDLTVQGDFAFFGAVLVRGALLSAPGGARVTGTVSVAAQGEVEPALDSIAIAFSRCAARKALLGIALPVPLAERSWSEAFEGQYLTLP